MSHWRSYVWAPILRRAGLRYRKPHTLRHTYASLLLERRESLHYVQQQLGHHSPAFTLTVYGHLIPEREHGPWTPWTRPRRRTNPQACRKRVT